MPTLRSRSLLPDAPYARFPSLLETAVIRRIGATGLLLAEAPLPPGDVTFVQIEVGHGVTFGLTAVAGPIRSDGSQILTACSEDDQSITAVAAQILQLNRPHALRWSSPRLVTSPPIHVTAEVPHVR